MVSIIIPMYNCGKYIRQCLDSVFGQRWPNMEVILVDDCSTDNTLEICRPFIEKDHRCSLIRAFENGGPGKSRNMGIDAAKGDFVLFLDADDWLAEDAVEKLMQAREDCGADMVISAFVKIQGRTPSATRVSHFQENQSLNRRQICDYALSYMYEPGKYMLFSYCWGRLFAASLIKDKNIRFISDQRICEDVLFNFEYMRHANGVVYIDAVTYHYRFGNPASAAMAFVLKDEKPLLFYRDIWTAYSGILTFVKMFDGDRNRKNLQRITRLGHISHAIVLLVRACGCSKRKPLFELVGQMVADPTVQANLKYYSPLKGQSRLIPILMRLRLALPLILLCKYKYRKRYGKTLV